MCQLWEMSSFHETQKDKWTVLFVWCCEGRNVGKCWDEESSTTMDLLHNNATWLYLYEKNGYEHKPNCFNQNKGLFRSDPDIKWNLTFWWSAGVALVKRSQALQWDVAALQDTLVNVSFAFWSPLPTGRHAVSLIRVTVACFAVWAVHK